MRVGRSKISSKFTTMKSEFNTNLFGLWIVNFWVEINEAILNKGFTNWYGFLFFGNFPIALVRIWELAKGLAYLLLKQWKYINHPFQFLSTSYHAASQTFQQTAIITFNGTFPNFITTFQPSFPLKFIAIANQISHQTQKLALHCPQKFSLQVKHATSL